MKRFFTGFWFLFFPALGFAQSQSLEQEVSRLVEKVKPSVVTVKSGGGSFGIANEKLSGFRSTVATGVVFDSEHIVTTADIEKLKEISDRLEYEIRMIDMVDNMESKVDMTTEAFSSKNERKMELMRTWPDFVIETTQGYLQELELDEKYKQELLRVIEKAKQVKQELGLG